MNVQLIKELAQQMEKAQTTALTESPHSKSEEYRLAASAFVYNKEKGGLGDFYCPDCKNKGRYADVTESGNVEIKECHCMKKRRSIQTAKDSGMGGLLLSKRFDNFEQQDEWQKVLYTKVKEYADLASPDNCKWLTLLGQSGCGKTHLCCATSNQLIESGAQVVYMTWNNAVKELKRNATDDKEYSRLFDRYKNAEVLYIDDFFKGKVTETDITIAFELLNYRYNDQSCITIISSELLANDLFNIDEAIAGRILERCDKNMIQVKPDTKKNYRRKSLREL